jgi:hypothetical protein
MLSKAYIISSILFVLFTLNGVAQQKTLSIEEQLAQLELEMDSSSIFHLIDSILQLKPVKYSELITRFSYNNNVLIAGRNYGVNQHGISSGASYYHKSGVYADLSGYWNSAFSPKYNLTIASIGYMKFLSKNFSSSASYDRWFYNINASESSFTASYKNSINLLTSFNSKFIYSSLDYNYLFGSKKSSRIIGSISGNLSWYKVWIFDKIKIMPSFSMIYGNETITTLFSGDLRQEFKTNDYLRNNLESDSFKSFLKTITLSTMEQKQIDQIRNNQKLSARTKSLLITNIYLSNDTVDEYIRTLLAESKTAYGIMNYSFSLPVFFTIKHFTWSFNYTYSLPQKLPGEIYELRPIGYFGTTLSYRIPFR